MVQQQLNWPFLFLKVCNHFQMLKTILCKFTILHIIYCGMWHILQETFGARNNCKAVAFVSRKEKQKKRNKKEKAEGRVRKEPPASLGFSPLHWPAHLTPGRLPCSTDPVATGARSPRTASPSTTRGRIRPPRPRRLGCLSHSPPHLPRSASPSPHQIPPRSPSPFSSLTEGAAAARRRSHAPCRPLASPR